MKRLPSIAAVTGKDAAAVIRAVPGTGTSLRLQFAALFGLALLAAAWAMSPAGKPAAVHVSAISAPSGSAALGAKWIVVRNEAGRKFVAAVFRPEGRGPFPVVVALHGAGGLLDHHLEVASRLSHHGFLVVAGCWHAAKSPVPICAQETPDDEWRADPAKNSGKDLVAAVRYLPAARANRVALYGMSSGGNAALWTAGSGARVRAVVVDYTADSPATSLPTPNALEIPGKISVPVLLMRGTNDPVILDGGGRMVDAETEPRPEAIQRAVTFLRKHIG